MCDPKMSSLVEGIFDSASISDVGPLLISSHALRPFAKGVAILRLYNFERFEELISLGSATREGLIPETIFDDHPVAEAVRLNSLTDAIIGETRVYAAPIFRQSTPLGALVVTGSPDNPKPETLVEAHPVICTLIGRVFNAYFTLYSDRRNELIDKEPLSSRQLFILQCIRDGMTNEQIARRILVSASTVRQETVKIFRHLSVSNRKEAALRAIELGLISSPDFETANAEVGETINNRIPSTQDAMVSVK